MPETPHSPSESRSLPGCDAARQSPQTQWLETASTCGLTAAVGHTSGLAGPRLRVSHSGRLPSRCQPSCVPGWGSAPSSKTLWLLAEFSPGVGAGARGGPRVLAGRQLRAAPATGSSRHTACFFKPVDMFPKKIALKKLLENTSHRPWWGSGHTTGPPPVNTHESGQKTWGGCSWAAHGCDP